MYKLKKYRFLIFIVGLFITIYSFGPRWIAQYYMLQTNKAEINNYKSTYWEKADKGVWDQQREYAMIWCRVRGIEIDEGHIGPTISEKWSVVIDYWKRKNK